MLASARPGDARPPLVPARRADEGGGACRGSEAGLAAAARAESQEACFLAGDDYRAFLERRGLGRATGPIVDEAGHRLGSHDGSLAVHARASAEGSGSPPASRSTRSRPMPGRTPSSSARARRSRATSLAALRPPVRAGRTRRRRRSATARAASPATVAADPRGFRLSSTSPSTVSRRGRPRAVRGRRRRRRGHARRGAVLRSRRCSPRSTGVTSPTWRSPFFLVLAGGALRLRGVPARRNPGAASRS